MHRVRDLAPAHAAAAQGEHALQRDGAVRAVHGACDDEEEEDQPFGPKPGQEEGPSKEGKEMPLSPEQAGWLLDAYKLDSERRLPMGQGPEAKPRDRSRPTW